MRLENNFNDNLNRIMPSPIRSFDQAVSQIPGIIKLTLGEPDFATPKAVKEAAKSAIDLDYSHYTHNAGTLNLRETIADFMLARHQLSYDADTEITVTIGATEGYTAALLTVLNPGDCVLISTPTFPGYEPVVTMAGAEAIHLDTSSTDFVLNVEQLEAAFATHGERIKAIVLNYPSNPTGVTYTKEELAALARVLRKHDVFVIADEIYAELIYDVEHISIARFLPEQTIVVQGLSKSHAMTGWRVGFVCAPAYITTEIRKTHQFLVTSTPTMLQVASEVALREAMDATEEMRQAYQIRRDIVCDALASLNMEVAKPNGAFYVFAKIPEELGLDDNEFCERLAERAKLAVIAGSAFGPGGEGYVRISYAADVEMLRYAMNRLSRFLNEKLYL
ncbi:aminotransferase class I/II-fold pyridoxal phosphate-dependent enzyme [Vagococcus lutrae]|uniref:aminotransferase class I/II-fold pyridoxal phosphate-dependent enzyme n=1 Tax=Vagococcus lutrae TaxID=81947 RepID=UPI001C964FB6|nr:aminotransferase class I/II-fold pyridoxal phosphate-dependent enzyme [Vagococcus lutrae]QZN89634.1 aminotransferase class I/II-fold pyridoxal phosphate-dependent enzyme [Vagococcus lutrae]